MEPCYSRSIGSTLPLARISLLEGKPESYLGKVSDAIHRAMVQTIAIPQQDRFRVITETAKTLVEVAKENWSFGNGEAQYAS